MSAGLSRLPPLPPRKNSRRVTMPTSGVGPFVKLFFAEMARQGFRYDDMEFLSGVRRASQKAWRRKNAPGLASIQATLGVLGYSFVAVPAIEKLPPQIAGDLAALAAKMKADLPATFSALVDIGVGQKLLQMSAAEKRAALDAHMDGVGRHANDNAKRRAAS